MVQYHSEAWLPETTVGGNSWEPGWYHFLEREGIHFFSIKA